MMRTLIVGAGATGGFFGTRLVRAGRDVTFLVHPNRAEQLRDGLRVYGPGYDETVPVRTVTAPELDGPYDLVLLMTKAWSLDDAMEDIAPAVGTHTTILPLLNGMVHLERLNDPFGPGAVLGGIVRVVCTMTPEGAVFQMKPKAGLIFGEQGKRVTDRVLRIKQELAVPGYDVTLAEDILASMWHKWAFIAAGFRHEGEHLLGEFVATAEKLRVEVPLTRLALAQIRVHDRQRDPVPQPALIGSR